MQETKEKQNTNTSENSFLVSIKYRQNSSWQGTVQWVETGKIQNFKSCLELVRLIDMAVGAPENKENQENK